MKIMMMIVVMMMTILFFFFFHCEEKLDCVHDSWRERERERERARGRESDRVVMVAKNPFAKTFHYATHRLL